MVTTDVALGQSEEGRAEIMKILRGVFSVLALTMIMALVAAPPAEGEDLGQCESSLAIPEGVRWISTLAFDRESGALLITDPSTGVVHAIDPATGDPREAWEKRALAGEGVSMVMSVGDDQLLVKLAGEKALILGPESSRGVPLQLWSPRPSASSGAESAVEGSAQQRRSGLEVGSLYGGWTTTAGKVLGYGSVTNPAWDATIHSQTTLQLNRDFRLGILQAELDLDLGAVTRPRLLHTLEANDYYRLGYTYFAHTTDAMYYAVMNPGSAPALYRLGLEAGSRPEKIEGVPKKFLGALPSLETAGQTPQALFGRFQELSVVAGIYGFEGQLYVLTREPAAEGTKWLLHPIDSVSGKPVGQIQLSTNAAHLSLLAASDGTWYIAERGEVRGWARQSFGKIIRCRTTGE